MLPERSWRYLVEGCNQLVETWKGGSERINIPSPLSFCPLMSGQYLSLVKPNQKTEDRGSAAIVHKRQPPRAQSIMDRVESVEASIKYLAHSGTRLPPP